MPKVDYSIIIPNLNSPVVHHTIASLEIQDYEKTAYEIIVVGLDCHNLIQPNDLVSFDRTNFPLSPAAARNRGVTQAQGKILAFIDADCIASTNWLTVLASRFSSPDVNIVGGGISFDPDNYWTLSDNLCMFHEYLFNTRAGTRKQLPSLNLAIRKNIFTSIGGFDERYPQPAGEDSDLTIRLRKAGEILHFEPRAIVKHVPQRHNFFSIIKHGYRQGKFSVKVDSRHLQSDGLPWPLHTRIGVLIAAPLLALGATLKILLSNRSIMRYWTTLPTIFCAKIAWCFGAATHPW